MSYKYLTSKKKIDTSNFVDGETGESLQDLLSEVTSFNTRDVSSIIINSENYLILDENSLALISPDMSPQDLGRILIMARTVRGIYNILYKDKLPYNDAMLAEDIFLSRNKYADFMNKIHKKGIISYMVSYINGKKNKFIIFNPFLARKSKVFSADCLDLFQPFLSEIKEKQKKITSRVEPEKL